jgi:two-component system nitrate/nitrite response regulator NarL
VADPLRLLVVAEDSLARAGLRAVAEGAGLTVVEESPVERLESTTIDEPLDLALWDLGAGTPSWDRLQGLATRVPVLAVLWSEDQAEDALLAGARGVLVRDRLDERLGPAAAAVAAGVVVVDEAVAGVLVRPRPAATSLPEPLTPRETEVLQLVGEGLTNRAIGERLGISEHTAKFHVNAILGKLGARSRSEAVAQAARLGLFLF